MAKDDRPLLGELRGQIGSLRSELREMCVLRWQLAWLELRADLRSIIWLAVVLVMVVVMALTALPLLAVALAEWLDGVFCTRAGWLLIFALTLLLVGGLAGLLAFLRFRRRFIGLEQTLEELREDVLWLREWTGQEEGDRPA